MTIACSHHSPNIRNKAYLHHRRLFFVVLTSAVLSARVLRAATAASATESQAPLLATSSATSSATISCQSKDPPDQPSNQDIIKRSNFKPKAGRQSQVSHGHSQPHTAMAHHRAQATSSGPQPHRHLHYTVLASALPTVPLRGVARDPATLTATAATIASGAASPKPSAAAAARRLQPSSSSYSLLLLRTQVLSHLKANSVGRPTTQAGGFTASQRGSDVAAAPPPPPPPRAAGEADNPAASSTARRTSSASSSKSYTGALTSYASMSWQACGGGRPGAPMLVPDSVSLAPDPPHHGRTMEVNVSGTCPVSTAGGKLRVAVLYLGFRVYSYETALCDAVECPLVAGSPFNLRVSQKLPTLAPPGAYQMEITGDDDSGSRFMCVAISFSVALPPGPGALRQRSERGWQAAAGSEEDADGSSTEGEEVDVAGVEGKGKGPRWGRPKLGRW